MEKFTSEQLRVKLKKCYKVQEKTAIFYNLQEMIEDELNKRNWTAIYRTACKVLKNRGLNQFYAAKIYADAVINGNDYFSDDSHHEIGSFYTKNNCPVIVYF